MWLVEAKAVRVDESAWAPVFDVVAQPSSFTEQVAEGLARYERRVPSEEVLLAFQGESLRAAASALIRAWKERDLPNPAGVVRGGTSLLSFGAPGPSAGGWRTVFTAYADGRIYVSFSAFSGKNSGFPISVLATDEYVDSISSALDLTKGYSPTGWLTPERVPAVLEFADHVIAAYGAALVEITDA